MFHTFTLEYKKHSPAFRIGTLKKLYRNDVLNLMQLKFPFFLNLRNLSSTIYYG